MYGTKTGKRKRKRKKTKTQQIIQRGCCIRHRRIFPLLSSVIRELHGTLIESRGGVPPASFFFAKSRKSRAPHQFSGFFFRKSGKRLAPPISFGPHESVNFFYSTSLYISRPPSVSLEEKKFNSISFEIN